MTYTDRQFAQYLQRELDAGYDPIRFAKRAFHVAWMDPERRERSREVNDALYSLEAMDEGPEFYMPEAELRQMAQWFMSSVSR